jgi:UDP-glucose:(glucosyl)LPS alpha-1,2-glucosyltransferase
MSEYTSSIVVILPPRERFRSADAGAVALTVRDFIQESRFGGRTVVFGGGQESFENINYQYVSTGIWSKIIGRNLAYFYACRQLLLKYQPQLIEVHNRIILALRIKAVFPNTQVVVYLHNDPQTMEGAKTIQQRQKVIRQLNAVYCVSDYVRKRLLDGTGSELSSKIHVIYNALIKTSKQVVLIKQPWLVYAGRFVPEKGVLELAKALAEILPFFPKWKVIFIGAKGFGHIAGRSKYEQQVYAALVTVAKQVEFRGHIPQIEVMEILAQSSVTVVPSICGEAFGRVALEAMLMANAVIVSNYGALPEVAGDAAIILSEVSSQCIKQTLNNLLVDESRICAVAKDCQKRAIDEFSLLKQVSLLDDARQVLM